MKVYYIGRFVPHYGGVNIKNNLIFDSLKSKIYLKKIATDKTPKNVKNGIELLNVVFSKTPKIIGISASRGKSLKLTKLFYKFNRKTMNNSIYFMMGGLEAGWIASDPDQIKIYSEYKKIYTETENMKNMLLNTGMQNVALYPNCRKRPINDYPIQANRNEQLKCVFMSAISCEKGVDIILESAKEVSNVEFYFYGHIDEKYEKKFINQIQTMENVIYKGIFDGNKSDVYAELGRYDVLLFPTKWKTEGVPGILVEGKIAGLTAIVSDMCYNAELVKDDKEGIVLKANNSDYLVEAINLLNNDRKLLFRLKQGSKNSAEKFYVDNYIDEIMETLLK
jgi:glycosyltransferase involved in cell wall biosynthesis